MFSGSIRIVGKTKLTVSLGTIHLVYIVHHTERLRFKCYLVLAKMEAKFNKLVETPVNRKHKT